MIETDSLNSKQRRAIRSLLTKPTIALAAQDCGTSEPTIYRWLRDDAFRLALTAAESDAIDTASRRLVSLTEASISVIAMTLADRTMHPALRLRAALAVLEQMLRLRELRSIEQRLSALEQASNAND